MQVEVDADTAQAWDAAGVAHLFATALCAAREGTPFFAEGRTLRVELAAAGRPATNASVSRCPGTTGQGLTVETVAEMLRPMVGRDLGEGMRISAVRAEGQTLVIVMDGATGWRTGVDQETMAWVLLQESCSRPGGFRLFDGTRTMRIDTTEGGGNLIRGQLISRCPTAPPAQR